MFFWENGDEDLVLSSFSLCKLKYLGPIYFTVYINFLVFSLKLKKLNDTLLPIYIFPNAMHESKRSVWSVQLTFPQRFFASV